VPIGPEDETLGSDDLPAGENPAEGLAPRSLVEEESLREFWGGGSRRPILESTEHLSRRPQAPGAYKLFLVFAVSFLLLAPLGAYRPELKPLHTGSYSLTAYDDTSEAAAYAYLRSLAQDGDLDFFNERGYRLSNRVLPTGLAYNPRFVGASLLWAPFYALGALAAGTLNALGHPVAGDGYSYPYTAMAAVGTAVYGFWGLALFWRLARKLLVSTHAALLAALFWCGTPLIYYALVRTRLEPALEFFALGLFFTAWWEVREGVPRRWMSISLGLALALAALVRPGNLLFAVVPAYTFAAHWISARRTVEKHYARRWLIAAAFALLGFAVGFGPQLLILGHLTGNPWAVFPAGLANGLLHPQAQYLERAWHILFGPSWGLARQAPPVALGLMGLIFLAWRKPDLGIPLAVAVIVNFYYYVVAYTEPAAYGQPGALGLVIPAALGAACVFHAVSPRYRGALLWAAAGLCIAWQYAQMAQYLVVSDQAGVLGPSHPAFVSAALGGVPRLLFEEPGLLLRSTAPIPLLLKGAWRLADSRDWFFLVVLPAGALLVAGLPALVARHLTWRADAEECAMPAAAVGLAVALCLWGTALAQSPMNDAQKAARFRQASLRAFQQGRRDEAVRYLAWSEGIDPADKALPYLRGLRALGEGEWESAVRHLQTARSAQPQAPWVRLALARAYLSLDRQREGREEVSAALSAAPRSARLHFLAARLLAQTPSGREIAGPLLRRAVELDATLAERAETRALARRLGVAAPAARAP